MIFWVDYRVDFISFSGSFYLRGPGTIIVVWRVQYQETRDGDLLMTLRLVALKPQPSQKSLYAQPSVKGLKSSKGSPALGSGSLLNFN